MLQLLLELLISIESAQTTFNVHAPSPPPYHCCIVEAECGCINRINFLSILSYTKSLKYCSRLQRKLSNSLAFLDPPYLLRLSIFEGVWLTMALIGPWAIVHGKPLAHPWSPLAMLPTLPLSLQKNCLIRYFKSVTIYKIFTNNFVMLV